MHTQDSCFLAAQAAWLCKKVRQDQGFLPRLLGILLLLSTGFVFMTTTQPPVAHAASSNPIVIENQQPGTTSWEFDNYNKASKHEIEGYASLTSVDQGGQISFMVSLSANAQYMMNIYRMGYYFHGTNPDGSPCSPCGGRLMQTIGPLSGGPQPACPTTTSGADFGMIECRWTPSYTLTVPTSWTSGSYIVKLTRLDDGLENYMTFVVRDDASTAAIVYSLDVTTWEAYSYWGGAGNNDIGYDLYAEGNDVTQGFIGGDARAYTVSFDRPYMDQGSEDGAGNFMLWDYPMIRWMESQGYDITYITDVDLEDNPNVLSGHRVFVNTGHDEYYSDNMRANIQNFINSGGNAAFFSADDMSRRMTWANSISGQPYRREHCDKGALPNSTTIDWRVLTPPQPENQITGSLSNGAASGRPFLVSNAASWIFAGTGLVNYNGTLITSGSGQNAIAGLIGYEFNTMADNDSTLAAYVSYDPPGLQDVGHSFVPASDNGVNSWADSTLYTSAAGGTVFTAGTIQWSWGVDNGFNDGFCDCNLGYANTDSQIITANILNRFVAGLAPIASVSPTSLSFGNQNVGTTSVAQTVTLSNTGTTALTISSIGLGGSNAGVFSETSTCPISPSTLAAGASCSLSATFTPTANGARSATLTISDNATGSPQSVALTGTGVTPAPAVGLTPTSVTFANQNVSTTSAVQTVTLTNTGTIALSITGISLGGSNSTDFTETSTCPISPSTLAAGASCLMSVMFTPSTNGTRSATVTVSDNAADTPQSIPLSGTGVTPSQGLSLIGSSTANGNFGAGVKIKVPTVQAGDLLIAVAGTNGSPNTWTTPSGWTAGSGSGQPDGQGLNWWWKIATGTDSGTTVTLKSSSYADGGGVILDYRGAAASPILAVSSLTTNDNGGNGNVTSVQFGGVSWSGSDSVASLLLMSWQPASTAVTWPTGYTAEATATDGYGYVAVGADLASQETGSLSAQSVHLSTSQAVVPALQIAVLVG